MINKYHVTTGIQLELVTLSTEFHVSINQLIPFGAMDSQTEQLQHLHAECDCKMLDQSHDHTKEPRPPDIEESEEETDSIMIDSNLKLPVTVIVPRFIGLSPQQDIAGLGNSLGSVSLPPQQYHPFRNQDLVWLGSSLGTMHKVPVDIVRTSHQVPIRTPSVLSKDMLSSSRLGSQTVSECGTDMFTICRICQMPGDEKEPLISPCRCSGSLRYIHFSCLKKWIRISQRRGKKTGNPKCELCHYQFNRHKRFKFSQWRWPRVRRRDKCLHIVFLLNLLIMVGCAIATVMCFLSDRGNAVKFPKEKVKLTTEEVITLTCGVMFFVAFFVAMTVEIKARHTLYKLFLRFITHNTEWTVEPYDPTKDPLFRKKAFSSTV